MDNFQIPVEVDPNEDTEWNDILREKGIIPEKPPSPSEELEEALQQVIAQHHENRLENKDLDELDELEDDEDEDFLNSYKAKRMQQLQKMTQAQKFGLVYNVTKPEYEKEITLASDKDDGVYVLLHMSLQSNIQSRVLASLFITLASKYPELKFTDIPASRCVENYPESNCPTILIYYKKNVVKQFITLTQLGGNSTSIKDMEQVLVDIGAVNVTDRRLLINQDDDEDNGEDKKLRFMKKSIRSNNNDDDDDDDFFD